MDHDEIVEKVHAGLVDGSIDEKRVLAEIYAFTHEFRSVMMSMTNGKMGGIMGRLFGKMADAEPK